MDNDGGCRRFILVDDEYKFFFDHLSGDNTFLPPFDDDNGESETRNLGVSKRSKLGGGAEKKPINNRVPQQRTRESTERENRASERRKRKMGEFESVRVSRAVPLVNIQGDSKAREVAESKVETLSDVPLVRATQRDNKARTESKVDTLRDVRTTQRDNKARKVSESTKVETLQDVPLFRTKEAIQRDNRFAERRKKKINDTKEAETSRFVHMERVNRAVDKTPVTQSNKGVSVRTRKKSVAVVDKDYMSYLTWLIDSLKGSTTVPCPTPETQKQAPDVEQDTESCSDDDDDIIMVSDSPLCGEGSPFVVSKSKTVIDLEKDSTEDESRNCVFTKELMDVLKRPHDEGELLRLSGEVSVKKPVTRCRELRKGRVSNYETSELGPSYLEKVSDFDREYRRVVGDDKGRLKLLRGFFFYLKNVTRAGAFKPWLPENQKKLRLTKQYLQL